MIENTSGMPSRVSRHAEPDSATHSATAEPSPFVTMCPRLTIRRSPRLADRFGIEGLMVHVDHPGADASAARPAALRASRNITPSR
jgi:hypothetical protein